MSAGQASTPIPVLGVNLPWFLGGYGHDLGRNESFPHWPGTFRPNEVAQLLAALKQHGVQIVRLWLFEDAEGIVTNGAGVAAGLDAGFARNIEILADLLREAGISAYWVLLDANAPRRRPDIVTRAILTRNDAADAFFRNVLAPLLPTIAPVTWGIDLCNEPEAVLAGVHGNGTGLGFDWAALVPSLRGLAEHIRCAIPGCAVSVGAGYCAEVSLPDGRYAPLALDAYDAHFHNSEKGVPNAASLSADRPVILGELGLSPPEATQAGRDDWLEFQTQLATRLHKAVARGYAAIFLWMTDGLSGTDRENLFHKFEAGPALHAAQSLVERGLLGSEAGTLMQIASAWRGK